MMCYLNSLPLVYPRDKCQTHRWWWDRAVYFNSLFIRQDPTQKTKIEQNQFYEKKKRLPPTNRRVLFFFGLYPPVYAEAPRSSSPMPPAWIGATVPETRPWSSNRRATGFGPCRRKPVLLPLSNVFCLLLDCLCVVLLFLRSVFLFIYIYMKGRPWGGGGG